MYQRRMEEPPSCGGRETKFVRIQVPICRRTDASLSAGFFAFSRSQKPGTSTSPCLQPAMRRGAGHEAGDRPREDGRSSSDLGGTSHNDESEPIGNHHCRGLEGIKGARSPGHSIENLLLPEEHGGSAGRGRISSSILQQCSRHVDLAVDLFGD